MEAHHFCACPNEEVRQCVIYDSDKPNARLIGLEYIISRELFEGLPEEEKVYWHSHKFEVLSGTLQVFPFKIQLPEQSSEAETLSNDMAEAWLCCDIIRCLTGL